MEHGEFDADIWSIVGWCTRLSSVHVILIDRVDNLPEWFISRVDLPVVG